jgi:asparagine synthase (glutamine-hydrolysing)
MQGSKQKVILRHLMKGKLPQAILQRKKVGFDIPAHEWLRGQLRQFMLDVLNTGLSSYPEVFERSAIERCIRRHLERVENLGYHLWGLMILFLWMQRWKVQTGSKLAVIDEFESLGANGLANGCARESG